MSEEQDRLRLQLDRDLAMHEAAGNDDLTRAVKKRLAELDKEEKSDAEPAPKAKTATKKEG